jgi:Ca2+-binding RTX toxin-like protein
LSGWAVGGNDTLIAGPNPSNQTQMYGDGAALLDHARGGNDTLISGPNDDQMWGDAATVARTATTGADTLVFSPLNAHDTIEDFQPGQDHIELQGYANIASFAQLMPFVTDTKAGALIAFDASDSILVVNDHHLTSGDFIFT